MRRLASLLAVFALLLTGCSSKQPPQPQPIDVTAYLHGTATEDDKRAIKAAIEDLPGVSDVRFESKEEAYANFKEMFKDAPDMVESVTPDVMPQSFRFRMRNQSSVDTTKETLSPLPGVSSVVAYPMPTQVRTGEVRT